MRRFHRDVRLHAGQFRAQLLDGIEIAVADEQDLGARGGDHVLQLGQLGAVVHRKEHAAERGSGIVGFHVVVRVGLQHRDAVAALDAERPQRVGETLDVLPELAVGEALVLEDQNLLVLEHRCRNTDKIRGIHRTLRFLN